MAKVRVFVRLKPGVLDPQGQTMVHALHALDFASVQDVRVGKLIELTIDDAAGDPASQVKAMCDKLMVNPVIEDYHIEEN